MNSSQGFPRLALFLCGCAAFLNLYTTQGIFDELAASFHISAHQSNWSITATTLAVALAAPFVGRLSGGRERSRVIAFAASLLCVPMLLAAHAGSFAAFLLWRFAEGMLIPLLFASSVAYIGERWSGGAVIELTSLYVAGTILGGFAGRFLTGLLTEVGLARRLPDPRRADPAHRRRHPRAAPCQFWQALARTRETPLSIP